MKSRSISLQVAPSSKSIQGAHLYICIEGAAKINVTNLFLVETFLGETFSTSLHVPLDHVQFNSVADSGT